jgi:predicted acetyltransferase
VTALRRPDVRLHRSWAETLADFGGEFPHGSGIWHLPEDRRGDHTLDGCVRWVDEVTALGDVTRELEGDTVHCDFYWITDGDQEEVVGFLALRHSLNDWLLEEGGHIGYSVRPSRRREGHARRALGLALDRARVLGLDRVLVTCDEDNDGSRRTIEGAGGILEDTRNGKRRYWIDLAARTAGLRPATSRDGADAAPA